MSESINTIADLQERLQGNRFAMITSIDERGTLSSRPVTVQKLADDGDIWMLVDRNSDWVPPIDGAPVNASLSDDRTWVSFAGRASLVADQATVDELTDPMADTFFGEGADKVALHIVTDRIEWWASPNKAVQLIELAKAKVTGGDPAIGDSGAIEV